MNQRDGHAPGFPDCHLAAGQPERNQMSEPAESRGGPRQELATPDRAIAAITRAVESDAQDLLLQPAMLEHPTYDVRVVMLDRHPRKLGYFGPLSRKVIGMFVVNEHFKLRR